MTLRRQESILLRPAPVRWEGHTPQGRLAVAGPAAAVALIWTAMDLRAAHPAAADGRTLDQRRFDALVDICVEATFGPDTDPVEAVPADDAEPADAVADEAAGAEPMTTAAAIAGPSAGAVGDPAADAPADAAVGTGAGEAAGAEPMAPAAVAAAAAEAPAGAARERETDEPAGAELPAPAVATGGAAVLVTAAAGLAAPAASAAGEPIADQPAGAEPPAPAAAAAGPAAAGAAGGPGPSTVGGGGAAGAGAGVAFGIAGAAARLAERAAGTPAAGTASKSGKAARPRSGRRGIPGCVYLYADAATWAGLADDPVELAGYGPIPAGQAREFFASATWRAVVADALTGATMSVSDKGYVPSARTLRHLHVQDRGCLFPGCPGAIWYCDTDHNQPYDKGGCTDTHNCGLLCRRHHLLKTFHGWTWQRLPDNEGVKWTDPRGRSWYRPPNRYLLPPAQVDPDPDGQHAADTQREAEQRRAEDTARADEAERWELAVRGPQPPPPPPPPPEPAPSPYPEEPPF